MARLMMSAAVPCMGALMALAIGCQPTGYKITPVPVDRGLEEKVLITDGDHSFELHHHLDGLADAHADGGGFDTLAADDEICGRIITVIRECSKPVVAATRGDIRDAGLGFYLAADVRLAARSASFTAPSMQTGLIPGWGLLHTLPGLMGQGRALEFLWSGRTVSATEAYQLGLVDRLLDDEVFEDELDAIAARLRTLPQPAVHLTKLGVQQAQQLDMTSMLAYEWETQQQCWSSRETAEGMAAWRDGRDPVLDAPTQPEED